MKLQSESPDAIISNVESQGSFRIKNSAKAFSILSSGLYSNKIKAIVRELSCNAVDSHKEAGIPDTPFLVHLPNVYEPYFSITDFGTGLDHEGITQLYTTYFESTKQDSNDYIGALGLGSKSPFSYTDNFSVIAKKDGMLRIYTAYIADTGCPAIALMSESVMLDKSPQNGIEVKFSVTSTHDFRMFVTEAHSVFKWFKQKPDVIGNSEYEHQTPDYQETNISDGVHLLQYGKQPYAIQGNIAYPINLPDSDEYNHLRSLLKCPIVLEFELGELDIAASREELSYIPWTVKNIVARLEVVAKHVEKYVSDQIKDMDNEWDIAHRLNELYNKSNLFKAGVLLVLASGKCSLLIEGNYGRLKENTDVLGVTLKELAGRGIKLTSLNIDRQYSGNVVVRETKAVTDYNKRHKPVYYEIPLSKQITFIINDTTKGPLARVRYHYKETTNNSDKIVFVLDVKDKEQTAEILTKFYRRLKYPPVNILKVSELAEKDKLQSVKSNLLRLTHKEKYESYSYRRYWVWDKVTNFDSNTNDTYYYVPVSNYTVLTKCGNDTNYKFIDNVWPDVKLANLCKGITVYGVRKSYIKAVEEDSNWICIYDLIEEELNKVSSKDILDHVAHTEIDTTFINNALGNEIESLQDDSEFKIFFNSVKGAITAENTSNTLSPMLRLIELYNIDVVADTDAEKLRIRTGQKKIFELYPMLKFVDSIVTGTDTDAVINYINIVDHTRRVPDE